MSGRCYQHQPLCNHSRDHYDLKSILRISFLVDFFKSLYGLRQKESNMQQDQNLEMNANKFLRVFDAQIAERIGLNEAIILNQIEYWLSIFSKENNKQHKRDGKVWVFETYAEWHEQFPFLSVRTIRRTIDNLCKIGVVIATDEYNRWKNDHTKWYTIDYDILQKVRSDESWCGQNGHIVVDKMDRQCGQNGHIVVDKMDSALPKISSKTSNKDFNTKSSNSNDDCSGSNAPCVSDSQKERILFGMVRKVFFKGLDIYHSKLTIEIVYDMLVRFLELRERYRTDEYFPCYNEIEMFVSNLSSALYTLENYDITINKGVLMRIINKFFILKGFDRNSILKLNQLEHNMICASCAESEKPEQYNEVYKDFEYGI